MSTAIASFVPRCTIALITALTSCQHNFHVYQTVKGNKGNKTQGVTWYKKNKTQATTLDAKEHSGKVEPKPSGLVLFFQMPRGLTPQSCPKDGSWLHMKLTRDLVWSKKQSDTSWQILHIIETQFIQAKSMQTGVSEFHTNQKNCDLNGGPNQHIWLLCSSHRLCCLYEGFLISTCTGDCYAFPHLECEDAKLTKKKHEHIKECTSAVGPRCYHHCRQCGCTASRKGIRSPDNTFWTFCRSKKRNRQPWKRKGLCWNFFQCPSRFIRSFSKRGSWWTSWQSCPEILMLQGKIRWFTALLRRALGSQTVMIPCFQLPQNHWSLHWCDSDWFRLFSQTFLFGIQDATKHACSILHLHSPNVTMTCRVPSLQS